MEDYLSQQIANFLAAQAMHSAEMLARYNAGLQNMHAPHPFLAVRRDVFRAENLRVACNTRRALIR